MWSGNKTGNETGNETGNKTGNETGNGTTLYSIFHCSLMASAGYDTSVSLWAADDTATG